MTLTALGKNAALGGVTAVITHLGLLQAGTPLTAVTGATSTDLFTKTAHGLTAGDLIVVSAQTGGTGIIAGRPYFVIATGLTANVFAVALTPGGTAVDLGTDVSTCTVTEYTEISGGSPAYARVTNSWNTAADGSIDNNVVGADVNVPAAATVNAIGGYSALTTGNLHDLAIVTAEGPYGAQGLYQITDYDVNINAAA